MLHARSHTRKKTPKRVLALPDLEHAKSAVLNSLTSRSGQRTYDHAMLAMLIGCGLRRGELLALTLESVQQREEHWVIADLVGKGGHVRTVCARLCHLAGAELEQIQFLLGHVSLQTTERYLGCKQKLRRAVNDPLGIEPDAAA